jgi:hypothetical protein
MGETNQKSKDGSGCLSECDMDQPSSSELKLIQDPETGLALLAKCTGKKTPEQEREHQFWQLQFNAMRDWGAGDGLAVGRAVTACWLFNRSPPFWLVKASNLLGMRCMSDAEKRSRRDINKHYRRWRAVQLVRGRHPNDPRNFKRKVHGDAIWAEAAKLVADMDADATVDVDTVKKSYALIKRAGGASVTLPSYRRAVKKRDRRRKKKN